jgi:hypothetical protein
VQLRTHWLAGHLAYQQHLQSARQHSRPRPQIPQSFLSLGRTPFRLK